MPPPSGAGRQLAAAPVPASAQGGSREAQLDRSVAQGLAKGPLDWLAGAASTVAGWAQQGLGSIANAAAQVSCARAIALAKPLLAKELGGGEVDIGAVLTQGYGRQGDNALLHVSFPVRGTSGDGVARLEAVVVPGGGMELWRLSFDGRELPLTPGAAAGATAGVRTAAARKATTKVIDVPNSSSL